MSRRKYSFIASHNIPHFSEGSEVEIDFNTRVFAHFYLPLTAVHFYVTHINREKRRIMGWLQPSFTQGERFKMSESHLSVLQSKFVSKSLKIDFLTPIAYVLDEHWEETNLGMAVWRQIDVDKQIMDCFRIGDKV